eukprot:767884-Hanusia_phi.AAC.3
MHAPPRFALVHPRRKRGENARSISEVTVTLKDIQDLFHLRQEAAAQTLGISLTAFKTACRQLGVAKWPYARRRLETEQTAIVEPSLQTTGSNALNIHVRNQQEQHRQQRPIIGASSVWVPYVRRQSETVLSDNTEQKVVEKSNGAWDDSSVYPALGAHFDLNALFQEAMKHVEGSALRCGTSIER